MTIRDSKAWCGGVRGLIATVLLGTPAAAFGQGYEVFTDRASFLEQAALTSERIESDDFSAYEEGEVDSLASAQHRTSVVNHTRLSILDGIDPSIPFPGSPARDTRLFIDDVTTESEYSNTIRFEASSEEPAARFVLRPVEVNASGMPLASEGAINSGVVRMRLVSGRVRGIGIELTGVTRAQTSMLILRFFQSGFDLYLDVEPTETGEAFIGVVTDQPFDAAQLWVGSVAHGESVGIASIATAFTDPPVQLGCPGDTNWDEIVNLNDLNALLSNFGDRSGVLGVEGGDVNGDHEINLADLNLMLVHFGLDGCSGGGGDDGGGGDGGGDGGDGGGGDGGDGGGGDGGDGGDGGGGDGGDGGGGDGGDGGGGGDDPPSHGDG